MKNKELAFSIDYYPELKEIQKRYLGLLGCIVEYEAYRTSFYPSLEALKQKHFPHSPDDPIILHRKELVNKEGPFWRLRQPEKEEQFNNDLLTFLQEQRYVLIVVVIDKKSHIERYGNAAYHPYHYCMAAMLERYCGFLNFYNAQGDVLAESRGKTEDQELRKAYQYLYNSGTQFRDATFFQKTLTSKEIKLKPKTANIAGLQVADILAYPLKQQILLENGRIEPEVFRGKFGEQIVATVENKLNRHHYSGKIEGYGKVFLK
ncbi:hypothetical protein MGLY_16390 [Neomoorella glycerini]|uniref:Uncharacterized protein n=2 Tax=Neomoorella glycerini TaxID=55779 RepID=A0A6I5ZRA8_9FIRM|nr:hypothetical protein MGLY_16390 [Moorella glycerini]